MEPFYRSIYPTLSSSKISRIIITSTPNGRNKFYDLYMGAILGDNAYHGIRVDWWQVPGRDDAWKAREIANLGSEELFNQEYGNRFNSASNLLLSQRVLSFYERLSKDFEWYQIAELEGYDYDYSELTWDKDQMDLLTEEDQFVISVDTADGVGRDYSIINIFKVEPMSMAQILNFNGEPSDWSDFFRLRQIGIFRSNSTPLYIVARLLRNLMFDFFGNENCRLILEINFRGDVVINELEKHEDFFPEIIIHTKHTIASLVLKMGLKIGNNKGSICANFKSKSENKQMIIVEDKTVDEFGIFGIDTRGRYSAQGGHDDCAMSAINASTIFGTQEWYELVEKQYEFLDDDLTDAMDYMIERDDMD
jgi:hypothetical protein